MNRKVLYRKWSQVKPEDIMFTQSPLAYVWSKDEYDGTFLSFVSAVIINELVAMGLIQTTDGHIVQVPIAQFRFVDL